GIKKAEIFYQEIEKEHLSISKGEVENFQSAKETGVGIRIIKNNKQGFAYTNNLEKIEEIFEKALNSAEVMPSDENWVLSENFQGKDLKEYPEDPSITKKIEALKETEKKIFSKDSRIKSVRNVVWEVYRGRNYIVNTLGTNLEYNYQYQYVYADIGVSDGKEDRGAWEFKSGKTWYDLDFEDLVDKVTWKALSLLGAKPKPSQRTIVILPPSQAQELLEVFSQAFSSEMVQKGKSILKGLMGEKVASEKLTIIEDPTYEKAFIRRNFDDEGVRTKEKHLIREGYLENFLYDLYTAKKEGKSSTGNGVRDSFKGLPKVGVFNLYIKPGERTEEEL
ncbi:MAG: TldD/PmbA family protein, partial [Caldanaerobacter sp.]